MAGYWMLQYSVWDGLTVADLVLPMFIFASGASTALFVEVCDMHLYETDVGEKQ